MQRTFFNCTVHLKVANTSTLSWINKQTAPNEDIFKIVKTFWDFCIQRNIWVKSSYIESKHNKVADKESRKVHDSFVWTLKEHVFEKVIKLFGKVIVDLFVSLVNHKVERYSLYTVDTDSCGVDCFTKNWAKEIIYAFPPFAIIYRMLKTIEKDEATGAIIVPQFTTQPWLARLLRILIEDPHLLPKTNMSLHFRYSRKEPPTMSNVTLMACRVSGNPILQKEYQKKLYQSSCNPGEQVRKSNIRHTFLDGFSFVLNGKQIPCNLLFPKS